MLEVLCTFFFIKNLIVAEFLSDFISIERVVLAICYFFFISSSIGHLLNFYEFEYSTRI